jgi:hypothetical protein
MCAHPLADPAPRAMPIRGFRFSMSENFAADERRFTPITTKLEKR